MTGRPRLLLGLAAIAVAFAAADTYVVVLALPDMMTSVGIPIDQLQRAAPIVSGFLLGYVAMLPLIGRIADLRGRVPVLVAALVLFALGSLVTTLAYDMPSLVCGRFLQGVGGGGLVPATLALVADLYPPQRRGVPLGVVGAVQEVGSVLGPLYGALVLAVSTWHAIFALNLVVGAGLAVALRLSADPSPEGQPDRRVAQEVTAHRDWLGGGLLLLTLVALVLTMLQPPALTSRITLGLGFVPFVGESRWLAPVGLATVVLAAGFLARCLTARRPLVDVRRWAEVARRADLLGAALLAVALAGIILAFATADPEVSVFSPAGPWLLTGSLVAAALFGWHVRRAAEPLVPHGAFAAAPAWGALVVSFFVGSALIAAIVDIPIFAR